MLQLTRIPSWGRQSFRRVLGGVPGQPVGRSGESGMSEGCNGAKKVGEEDGLHPYSAPGREAEGGSAASEVCGLRSGCPRLVQTAPPKGELEAFGTYFYFLLPRPPVRTGSLCLWKVLGFVLLRCGFFGLSSVLPGLFLI